MLMGLSRGLLQSWLPACTNLFLLAPFYLDKGFPSERAGNMGSQPEALLGAQNAPNWSVLPWGNSEQVSRERHKCLVGRLLFQMPPKIRHVWYSL